MRTFNNIILEKKYLEEELMFYEPEKNSLWNYVAGYTVTEINKFLREGKRLDKLDRICSNIDSMMTKVGKCVLYRTVDWKYIQNIYKVNRENLKDSIGFEFTAKAYSSTTREKKNVWSSKWNDYEVFMEIETNNNTKGAVINDIFKPEEIDCADQNEVLLQRDLKFKIYDYYLMSENGKTRTIKNKNIYCLKIQLI